MPARRVILCCFWPVPGRNRFSPGMAFGRLLRDTRRVVAPLDFTENVCRRDGLGFYRRHCRSALDEPPAWSRSARVAGCAGRRARTTADTPPDRGGFLFFGAVWTASA